MFKKRSSRFRPSIFDRLEDRAVPSSGMGHAQVSAAATSTTTTATELAALNTELATAGTQVNAAFATFATSVRQLESSFSDLASPTPPTPAAALAQVTTLTNTLASSVTTALGGVSSIGTTNAAVIASGLNGTGAGSLLNQLTSLFNAATSSASAFTQADLPLLFASVEGSMGVAYSSTSIEGFVAGLGGAGLAPATSATATLFSPTTFGTQANTAYSTFATSIRTAETSIMVDSGSVVHDPTQTTPTDTITGTETVAQATTAVTAASDTLATALATAVTGTTAEPIVAFRQAEESAALAGLPAFLAIAAPNGAVLADTLPLFYAAGEVAINASYEATAIQGYLIGTFTATT